MAWRLPGRRQEHSSLAADAVVVVVVVVVVAVAVAVAAAAAAAEAAAVDETAVGDGASMHGNSHPCPVVGVGA